MYIDLYGIDNPHLWLLATTTTTTVMSMGDNCLNSFITSEKRYAGIVGHTSSIISLTVTEIKKERNVFKYGFILKYSKHKHIVLQIENTGFSTNINL